MTQINITRKLTQADMEKLVELGLMEAPKEASPKGKKLTKTALKGLNDGKFPAEQTDFAVRCSSLPTTANPEGGHTLAEYAKEPWLFVSTSYLNRLLPKGQRAIAPKGLWHIMIRGLKPTFLVHYSEVRILSTL